LLGHRRSDDVDLFADRGEPLEPIVHAVIDAAAVAGATVARVRTTPSYIRLEAVRAGALLRIDVANDSAPRLEAAPTMVGAIRVESLRDQRANKLVTVLGRSLRDVVDLFFIERAGLPAFDGLEDALQKDAGMDPAWLAWALDQVAIRPLAGMLLELDLAVLLGFRDGLVQRLLDRAGASPRLPQ
jgi:hypothetical protein